MAVRIRVKDLGGVLSDRRSGVSIPGKLNGRVVVVTGASRGIGRGIALSLGELGATVYVTGRSVKGHSTENLPQTIDETAKLVSERGGVGVALACDHADDGQVQKAFDSVWKDQGRLDVLVNNVWGGYENYDFPGFQAPFWKQPSRHWAGMFEAGVRAHLIASKIAAPLMMEQQHGLIVSTVAWDHDKYLGNLFYDVAKHAIVRMVRGMARELRPYNVSAIALAPGFARTERVLEAVSKDPAFPMSITESPEYTGRCVAALAADVNPLEKSGNTYRVGDLAKAYGISDVDGRQVPPFSLPDSYSW